MSILVNLGADGAVLGGELSLSRQVGAAPSSLNEIAFEMVVGVCK
jgi:hypothetical protein